MDVMALLSSITIVSTAVVSPLSSMHEDPIPASVTISPVAVHVSLPFPTTEPIFLQAQPVSIPATLIGNSYVPTHTPTSSPAPTSTPTPSLRITNTQSIKPVSLPSRTLKNNNVKIAFLGDSMTDTLGPTITEITDELKKTYPQINPTMYNYGVGGTNIDYGIERITKDYEYLGQKIPSLASVQPDIVVLESFAYNPYPFDTGAIDKHWMQIANAVDLLRQTIPNVKIVIAATIAPNAATFGDGVLGYSTEGKYQKVQIIKQYLESTINFAKGENIPLANAYHPSLLANGNGNQKYIHAGDNIHPSDEGRKFFSQIVAQTILKANYLE